MKINKYQNQDIPKHYKSTKSNISKSNRKSKHKHQYEECLIQYDSTFVGKTNKHTRLTGYCTVCGKIGSVKNGKYEAELEQLESQDKVIANFVYLYQMKKYMKDITISYLCFILRIRLQTMLF